PLDEYTLDKLTRRQLAKRFLKMNAQHPSDARTKQRLNFLPQAHQTGRRLFAGKKLVGLGLKYNDHRRQSMGFGSFSQLAQDRLMAQMHTVKRADSGHTTTVPGSQVM